MYTQQRTAHRSTQRQAIPVGLNDLRTLNELFSDAVVLPGQFYTPAEDIYKTRGVVALMYGILDEALTCFQKHVGSSSTRGQRLAKEAEEWFFADDVEWVFSFVNICAALDLDPAYLRRGLRRWQQQSSPGPQKIRRRTMVTRRALLTAA